MKIKQLHIEADNKIRQVQDEFNRAYPFLKIEFYKKSLNAAQTFRKESRLPPELAVGEALGKNKEGFIELSDDMTMLELEKTLKERFGMVARLFRKSGNLWMEITMSENWTLRQQNEHGREISWSHKPDAERNGNFDYDDNIN
jgi:hypothetical protein